jgi:hypothetical protein
VTQDPDVPDGPRIRLRLLLAFLRIAAGRRGDADVTWSGAGFTYRLEVTRGGSGPVVVVDHDPEADPEVVDRIRETLYPAP